MILNKKVYMLIYFWNLSFIMIEKIIPKEYFSTILDRLTRFEPAYIRYKRVFRDLLNKFYSQDKKNIKNLNDEILQVENIFNNSLISAIPKYELNHLFTYLEDKYFKFNELSYQYLSARLNISQMINEIEINDYSPKNLIWLKYVACNPECNLITLRNDYSLLYPIEKIILCEGQTEELLLEPICKLFGYDFNKLGVKVISAGGKNQVARKFYQMADYTKLPFFILLDRDAYKIQDLIKPKLRKIDSLYLICNGEFEDIIPKNILLKTINYVHKNDYNCFFDDFNDNVSMVSNLENIYKKYGFGDFKKAEFAKQLSFYIKQYATLDDFKLSEFEKIIKSIFNDTISFTTY